MAALLAVDAAIDALLALAAPVPTAACSLADPGDALGRYLAADVVARLTLPTADVSAMDGYALRASELPGPFAIVHEAAAGRPLGRAIAAGEAARIFTGAHVPEGADTVLMQEYAVVAGNEVRFPEKGPDAKGANIRARGHDFRAGATVGRKGAPITPALLGLLAAAGITSLAAHRRPKLAILSTGDELAPIGQTPGPGQIIDANGPMVAALLRRAGAEVVRPGPIGDDRAELRAAVARALDLGADAIITIGGASVGDHDLVKPVLEELGAALSFWKVAIRPGKPLLAGRIGRVPIVGLPGNPASAFVCARVFLYPLLRFLAGDPAPRDRPEAGRAGAPLAAGGPRRAYLRAHVEDGVATPASDQDSSLFHVLAQTNALLLRERDCAATAEGSAISFLRF